MKKEKEELCGVTVIHEDVIRRVRRKLNSEHELGEMAEAFKMFSDPTRLKIVNALMVAEMCVCDIAALLNMTQPAVSHHLKALRGARLIRFRRDGKVVYYSLDDEHINALFALCLIHVREGER